MIEKYPCSGEINSKIADAPAKLEEIKAKYSDGEFDYTDGVSVDYGNWRFNLRMSNTEPIIRLNVETVGDIPLMHAKTEELLAIIRG
jgi:phosphomannomutase